MNSFEVGLARGRLEEGTGECSGKERKSSEEAETMVVIEYVVCRIYKTKNLIAEVEFKTQCICTPLLSPNRRTDK
jgi:hypothetical protein